ncbi:MAG: DUF3826 domain-containing protein [Bacteroidales bacterium]|nr:DUF3826 domain-containing protein [Bacteroidales bacterium]
MKKIILSLLLTAAASATMMAEDKPVPENRMTRPLSHVMNDLEKQFGVKFKYNVDTTHLMLDFAQSRIRPYSIEETLQNVLAPFDFKAWNQGKNTWKIKPYEYPRRFDSDGEKFVNYLNSLYSNREEWEPRRNALRKEVRERLGIDSLLAKCVNKPAILGKVRKMDGYTVQNIALELLPGYYTCGSIYVPNNATAKKAVADKDKYPVIICPNGHWTNGRYNGDLQTRYATLARMGAICISYDIFGWGESEMQVGKESHATSIAHVWQALCGEKLLDYALTRKDVDPTRVASNGGSGGGTHAALLATIDDRFTACCPVVSVCSHFDGGCPCESGMPIQYSQGGTCNIELIATFAPKPVMIVGDEGDWTHTYPTIEIPYMQRIYGFYGAQDKFQSVFLPGQRHDFNKDKRQAVYDFFASVWNLPKENQDESKVTIEEASALQSFGSIDKFPAGARTTIKALIEENFDREMRQTYFELRWAAGLKEKAQRWSDSLHLDDPAKTERVRNTIYTHLKAVTAWHNAHIDDCPAGINPRTGEKLREIDRQIIADAAQPRSIHETLMTGLRNELTEEQVNLVLDQYTVGKVDFTMRAYREIVPNITPTEDSVCYHYLCEAREMAIDYRAMKEISEIFGIYKDKCEQYFNTHGRNWREMYRDYFKRRQAEKEKK